MYRILFLILTFAISPLYAKDIAGDIAVLQMMDKVTGRVKKVQIPVGNSIQFGELTIQVNKCFRKPPEETPENAAYLNIRYTEQSDNEVFKGWMFSSNPALSAMEDPVYDIWVVECMNYVVEETPNLESNQTDLSDEPESISDEDEIIED